MRNNKILRLIVALAIAVMLCGIPMTAYAMSDEDAEQDIDLSETLIPVITPTPVPESTPTPEPRQLTPPGNMNLVDDIVGVQAEDKEFITVITRTGNYFYIVIDRASSNNNVHFLNLVDEADLLALLEDGQKPATIAPAPIQPTPEPTPEPEPEPRSNNTGGMLIMLLIVGALGGGAYYYFKILKPKQAAKGAVTELDEFAFDEDEDDFDGAGTYEPEFAAEHEVDSEGGGDILDFTAEPESDGKDFNFDLGDFDTDS